jgi:lysyl oxidase
VRVHSSSARPAGLVASSLIALSLVTSTFGADGLDGPWSGPGGEPVAAASGSPADRLPDLAMARPRDLRIQTLSNGTRRLRFTGIIVNIGAGPFETWSSRKFIRAKTMAVRQRIYNTAGGRRTVATSAIVKYAGDGHDHWHVQRVAGYELYAGSGDGPVLRRGAKVGFCFFDTRPYRLSLARAPGSRHYIERNCGTRASRSLKIGLSVGWSDIYPWNFAWQWVNVTGLPAGQFLLKLIADPKASFVEKRTDNNCNWTRIRIARRGSTVTVLGHGTGCKLPGEPPPPPPSPSPTPTATPTPTPTP